MLVQNKGNHPYQANGLALNIGTNDVDEAAFEQFISHPLMKHLETTGVIVYEKEKVKPSAKETIAMVEDAFDIDMLENLKATEDRKTVLEAIDNRIEELSQKE